MWSEICFHQNQDARCQLLHLFSQSVDKDVLNTYYVPDTFLGAGGTAENHTVKSFLLCRLYFGYCVGWNRQQGNLQMNTILPAGNNILRTIRQHDAVHAGLAGQVWRGYLVGHIEHHSKIALLHAGFPPFPGSLLSPGLPGSQTSTLEGKWKFLYPEMRVC